MIALFLLSSVQAFYSAYSVLVHSVALGIQLTRVVGVELFRRTSYGSRNFSGICGNSSFSVFKF